MRRQIKQKKSVRFAPKTVDCPSDAVDNGDTDRLGSRRAWENSQRGYPFYRYSKSYLPTHGVFRKGNGCILYAFAGATCVRYAEAKGVDRHQPAHGARHNLRAVRRGKAAILIAALACRIGTTCVRYATKASKKTGLARLFGYIRNSVRKPTVFSIWLL